ncbi:MAG: LysR substrate-binding domain-containing protein [Pseudomonadales bacterium]|nr:LysR substrate-binding domain-containing protein [Pseudomonadales bacterium]
METKIPPLHLLRVFEAAGRLLSFKEAAKELFVTPSAVSHQIKSLEEQTGFPLFRRQNRALSLTKAGQELLVVVSQHLGELRQDVARIQRRYGDPSIRAHILPFMASEYVIPNLHHFQTAHPEIELRIETGLNVVDFALQDLDIGVRMGLGDWPGLVAKKLVSIEATPLCSPQYQEQHQMRQMTDLQDKTLIQIQWQEDPWKRWSEYTGIPLNDDHKLTLDSFMNSLTAAEQGLGVAVGLLPLAHSRLQQGRLVAPFDDRIQVEEAYYLVFRPEDADREDLKLFTGWLIDLFNTLDDEYRNTFNSDESNSSETT